MMRTAPLLAIALSLSSCRSHKESHTALEQTAYYSRSNQTELYDKADMEILADEWYFYPDTVCPTDITRDDGNAQLRTKQALMGRRKLKIRRTHLMTETRTDSNTTVSETRKRDEKISHKSSQNWGNALRALLIISAICGIIAIFYAQKATHKNN